MPNVEKKLLQMGIVLPKVEKPIASYVPAKTIGNIIYTSGADCKVDGKLLYKGKVGKDLTVQEGYEAARQTMINLLAVLKEEIGSLDEIDHIVKILGFVNSAPGFVQQPFVMDGASQLLIDVFGQKGTHARSAIATNELPFNTPIEIEMIVALKDHK